jgi:hypothetical protein
VNVLQYSIAAELQTSIGNPTKPTAEGERLRPFYIIYRFPYPTPKTQTGLGNVIQL